MDGRVHPVAAERREHADGLPRGRCRGAEGPARREDCPEGRKLVSGALQRADEPGELLAYWHSLYGRNEPKPLKRGIADAILRLYTEFSLLKYDTDSHGYRFGDVIERVHVTGEHPEVKGTWKGALYEHAIDRRHGRDNDVPEVLAMIRANAVLRKQAAEDPRALLDAAALKAAGMTWEDALSLAGQQGRQAGPVGRADPLDGLHGPTPQPPQPR